MNLQKYSVSPVHSSRDPRASVASVYDISILDTAAVGSASSYSALCTSPPTSDGKLFTHHSLQRKCPFAPRTQARYKHFTPALTHGHIFAKHGVNGMMSPAGFDLSWTQYQEFLVTNLNQMTYGTPDDGAPVKNLIIRYARDAHKATLFNYASMAYNNHFMFSTLAPSPQPPSPELEKRITESAFGSLASLRETFIATAAAMFGPGYTWLIKRNPHQKLSILNTYLAGTPFPGAHYRQQPMDTATTSAGAIPGPMGPWHQTGNMNAGSAGPWTESGRLAPGGVSVDVLCCVSTWEHCWLMDWGIGGKRGYLEAWWDSVDWGVVEANLGQGRNAVRGKEKQ